MLANTQLFKEAALDYKKNKGVYTKAPVGTRDFKEYWQEQKRRCKEGYSIAGTKITGRHYFFLNFTRMMRIPDSALKAKNVISAQVDAVPDFPNFWEIHYNWWWAKQISLKGITKAEYDKLGLIVKIKEHDLQGGRHIGCGKTRGCGWSYLEAADGSYNYNFIPGSKSYYFASAEDYLTKDGILTKAWDNLEWLNNHTQNYWRKNRQKKNTEMHKKASYLDGSGNEGGFKSEIMGVIVDNPNKVRGKRGVKLSFEEAGSFKKLKEAIAIARPLVEQGGFIRGQISVFGTGGEEGDSIEGLEDMFHKPHLYNMMEFENIWDGEELEGTTCGFYVPAYLATDKYIDDDGNADIENAIKYWEGQRAIAKKDSDPKTLDRLVAERPFTTRELFQRVSSNLFTISEVNAQIARVKSDRNIQGLIQHGVMGIDTNGRPDFKISESATPILRFPHKQGDDLTGCISVVERPYRDQNGNTPDNIYIIVIDPYYKDDAEDTTSLGDVRVILRDAASHLTGTEGDRLVAWYTGRPVLKTFHKNIFALAAYYNAKVQSEISGGGQGIIDYARENKLQQYLEYEPEMIHNKEVTASKGANKAYFMNMTTDRKRLGLKYFADWVMEIIHVNLDGSPVYRLNRIYDLLLLEEMRRFNDTGNFDRISSMILAMYMLKEKSAIEIETRQQESSVFNRPMFTDEEYSEETDWAALGLSNPSN